MGRKKASPARGDTNPLQRMLGAYLRLERTRLDLSSADVANRLGLTDTYFRLVESGRTALNQTLIFKVIELFAGASTATSEQTSISFGRFAMFLSATQWVGAEMATRRGSSGTAKRIIEDLALYVSEFQILYEQCKSYFELEDGSSEQRAFLEEVAAPEIANFLGLENYGRQGEDAYKRYMDLSSVPTLNIDLLLDIKQSLENRLFLHTKGIAARWERDSEQKFRYERGLYGSSDLIVSKENLDLFLFAHLRQRRFVAIEMIFMRSDVDEADLTLRFIQLLNAGRRRSEFDFADLTKEEEDKIHFICLNEDEILLFEDECAQIRTRDNETHEAYWSFLTHVGVSIAFVGLLHGNNENIRNLDMKDSHRKADQFTDLWNRIHVSRSNEGKRISQGLARAANVRQSVRRRQSRE